MTWYLDSVFREICTFSLDFFTGPKTIESLSKLLKQSPVKNFLFPCSFIKERLRCNCFPVLFVKYLLESWFKVAFFLLNIFNPANIYLLKVNNKYIRKRCKICSELIIKTSEWCYWRCSGVFIVNSGHFSHVF